VSDATAACRDADDAVEIFETHLARLSSDVLRIMAGDDASVSDLYTTCLRAHLAIGRVARAFELSDRVRGAQLTDLLDLDRDAGAAPVVVGAVRRWQRTGSELARTIEGVADQPEQLSSGAAARERIARAERELNDAEVHLGRVAPGVLAGRRRLPLTPALGEVQEQLSPGTLLVQYHVADDELLTWAVTRETRRVTKVPVRNSQLDCHVSRFHWACSDGASSDAERAALAEPLQELLIAPLASELESCEHVLFVPHRRLAMLPFAALGHKGEALVAHHTVAALPTASILARRPPGPPPARDAAALVLGDPATGAGRGLARLPGAATEASAVAALHGVTPLRSGESDRDTVLRGLTSARIAHLATHGYLHEGKPFSAELALAGSDRLTVADLVGTDTDLELVVLSACDSGRGRATAAGDLIGLTRALMSAGAQRLVVSLWPVDDQLACLTMVAFHRWLIHEHSPAKALAAAQREIRGLSTDEAASSFAELQVVTRTSGAGGRRASRDLAALGAVLATPTPSHPSSWAPFVLVGA
jgi:CHAT domain-containing protein